jgi:hypothetical protein
MSIGRWGVLQFCRLATTSLLMLITAVPVALIIVAPLIPAKAQFWGRFMGRAAATPIFPVWRFLG